MDLGRRRSRAEHEQTGTIWRVPVGAAFGQAAV
jgi:hypothetical protein